MCGSAVSGSAADGGIEVPNSSIHRWTGVPGGQDRLLHELLFWGAQQEAEGRLHVLWPVSCFSHITCILSGTFSEAKETPYLLYTAHRVSHDQPCTGSEAEGPAYVSWHASRCNFCLAAILALLHT